MKGLRHTHTALTTAHSSYQYIHTANGVLSEVSYGDLKPFTISDW